MTETYCVSADVKLKAGSAATALTAAQYTTLINHAENFVNHTLGKDLISAYAALDDGVKLILNDVASSRAAYIATVSDQTPFSSSAVTNLLNVNATIVRDGIALLKDKDVLAGIEGEY